MAILNVGNLRKWLEPENPQVPVIVELDGKLLVVDGVYHGDRLTGGELHNGGVRVGLDGVYLQVRKPSNKAELGIVEGKPIKGA